MTDSRLATQALETLSLPTPDVRLATQAMEVIASATADRRLASVALEVLVPTAVVAGTAYVGWGFRL